MSENPYAASLAAGPASAKPTDAEEIRQQYLKHEASVKSIGSLYLFGAIFIVPMGLFLVVAALVDLSSGEATDGGLMVVLGVVYAGIGFLQGATGYALRKLQKWGRTVATIFSVIGLLGVPFGTLISIYILYLLLSQKGTMVFSEEYKRVIEQTPHIKYKTSLVLLVLLAILVLVVVGAIVATLTLGI